MFLKLIKIIINFIKAQTKPYPVGFTIKNNKKIILWDPEIKEIDKK